MVSLRRCLTASVALIALAAATTTALGADSKPTARQSSRQAAVAYYSGEIARFRKQTWHWERVMGKQLTPPPTRVLAHLTPTLAETVAAKWRHQSDRLSAEARHPPHLRQLLCIHRFEGSWSDRGEPYWGGLQMDRSFQASYGGWLYRTKGTADHWSPLEQIWTAEKALKSRGYWPWPNTARSCGLL